MKHYIEKNKQNAIAFYRTAYLGNPKKAVERYVGAEYIQHNPLVGDGKNAFIEYFDDMAKEYPEKDIEFVRAIAEGDLVALHTLQTWPGDEKFVTMDFFRFDEKVKLSSTGIQYKKWPAKRRMAILCIKQVLNKRVNVDPDSGRDSA